MKGVHLALRLPEIVGQILFYLVNTPEQEKKKLYCNIYQCLFVNSLWHDVAFKQLWKHVVFEDGKSEYESFLKFVSIATNTKIVKKHQLLNTQPQHNGVLSGYSNGNGMIKEELESIENDVFMSNNSYRTQYYRSIRTISLKKIKEESINEPLERLAPYVQHLKRLDMYICDYFMDSTIQTFIKLGAFSLLTELSLAGCNRITDCAIIGVANCCKDLQHLDLRACGQVSDNSICEIAKNCHNLQHLNVGRVRDREKITIRSIGMIAEHTKVTVLGLAGCDMTDKCLALLAKHRGKYLERISVNNCHRLSNKTLKVYVTQCPKLSVFEMKECHFINDWGLVARLVQRRVLLTLCDQQNKDCTEWARRNGKVIHVRAPVK
ncbi:hypothetical protein BY458DRAFT_168221 [Sporodiniella umbellata]|nr:hypothetical protein BY458DRAFT_168221 [Sporodiniella umbellata]